MAALIVEVAVGGRHDTQFHHVRSFPFTIGRAYDNDLILADDTVSAHHLQIEASESEAGETGYFVRNLSTENGTWSGARQLGVERESLSSPMSLTLGRSHIKILAPDSAVAPARNFPHASWLTRWGSDLRVAIALLSTYLILSIYFALEKQSMWLNWEEVLVNQLFEIVLPLVVATVVGFISRILLHRWRFALQLSIACIALGILTFSGEVSSAISYWLTNNSVADMLSSVFIAVSFVGLLAWRTSPAEAPVPPEDEGGEVRDSLVEVRAGLYARTMGSVEALRLVENDLRAGLSTALGAAQPLTWNELRPRIGQRRPEAAARIEALREELLEARRRPPTTLSDVVPLSRKVADILEEI